MEKKSNKIIYTVLIGLLILLIVYFIGKKVSYIEPKYFWNFILGIPIAIGTLFNLFVNMKLNKIKPISVLMAIISLPLFIYLFVYLLNKSVWPGGIVAFYIGIPCCLLFYTNFLKILFKIKINGAILILSYFLGIGLVFLLEPLFTRLKNDSFILLFLLTIILVVVYPLSIRGEKIRMDDK